MVRLWGPLSHKHVRNRWKLTGCNPLLHIKSSLAFPKTKASVTWPWIHFHVDRHSGMIFSIWSGARYFPLVPSLSFEHHCLDTCLSMDTRSLPVHHHSTAVKHNRATPYYYLIQCAQSIRHYPMVTILIAKAYKFWHHPRSKSVHP